jgi:hypothetical protein
MKENIIKKYIFTVVIISILALAITTLSGYLFPKYETNSVEQYNSFSGHGQLTVNINESEGFTMEFQPEIESVSYEYLSEKSDVIVTGKVKEILPSKWNSDDGKRPHDSIDDFEWYDRIYTDVVIIVDEYLKSSGNKDEVIVRVFTGTVDGDVSTADYEASFQVGEDVLVYLIEDDWEYTKDLGPEHYFTLGSLQGKMTLTENGTAIGPHGNINLSDLVEMIP